MATWRYIRDSQRSVGEARHLGINFDPQSPPKFTRLHLLDAAGLRALQAEVVCHQLGYRFTNLMAQRRGEDLESAFAAIIEPYVGEPFITSRRTLPIDGNEADARRAVAVELKTNNGHSDLCFADGRPETLRTIHEMTGIDGVNLSGEFAYYSTDEQGFRMAALTGGTLLETPTVKIAVSRRERTGKVIEVDYPRKTLTIDSPWPTVAAGRVFEIGLPQRLRSYTATSITPLPDGTRLTVKGGADFYRSRIVSIDAKGDATLVECAAEPSPLAIGASDGLLKSWIASSNDQRTRFWRADLIGGSRIALTAPPAVEADFAPSGALRLWEYGVGDCVRQSTFVSVRRVQGGYEVQGDVDVEVTIGEKTHNVTAADLSEGGGVVRLK